MSLPKLDDTLEAMRSFLAAHERLDRVAGYWNGFEGWLKFEIATALEVQYGVKPWVRSGASWARNDIGVEYRYRQGPRQSRGGSGEAKLIDLWLGHSPTHYFELKVVFQNSNAGKQLRSWRADFEKLAIVLEGDRQAQGYASVLVAVGHDDKQWAEAIRPLADDSRFFDGKVLSTREPDRVGIIRFAALREELST